MSYQIRNLATLTLFESARQSNIIFSGIFYPTFLDDQEEMDLSFLQQALVSKI